MPEENKDKNNSLVKKLGGAKEKIAELKGKPFGFLREEISLYPEKITERATKAIRTLYTQPILFDLLGLPHELDKKPYAVLMLYLCRESGVTIDDLPF